MAYFDKYGVEFSDDSKTLVKCPEDFQGKYIIPRKVTCIRAEAFKNCDGLTEISMPNCITHIGGSAFSGCTNIRLIKHYLVRNFFATLILPISEIEGIPNSVTSIGGWAFYGCTGLTSVTIPNSVTSIGKDAFFGCSGLTSLIYNGTILELNIREKGYSWWNGSSIFIIHCKDGDVKMPHIVLYLSDGSENVILGTHCSIPREYKDTLVRCEISEGVTSIGSYAFFNCRGLTSVGIPNSVTSIGEAAFYGCSSLTSVTIGNSVTNIGNDAFHACIGLVSVTIPNSVTSIGSRAFYECTGLTSVTIPNSVTSIGDHAFKRCSSVKKLVVGKNLSQCGKSAFAFFRNPEKLVDSDNTFELVWNAQNFGIELDSGHIFY